MVFSKDTQFLNLVRGEREHKTMGLHILFPQKLLMKMKEKSY